MKKITSIGILLCLAFIGLQCSPEKKDFDKAKSLNTIEAYEEFVSQYPDSEYKGVIEVWIDSITFSEVKNKNTTEDYTNFASTYPNSNYLDSASYFIDKIRLDECLTKGTIASYIEFLEDYPKNSFRDTIVEKIKEKGTVLKISLNKLGSLSKFSDNSAHKCYLEYTGVVEPKSNEGKQRSSYTLYFQNEDREEHLNEVAKLYGEPGQELGGYWEYGYYSKGEVMYTTTYDAYGRPTTTTHKPSLTISVHVQFVVISANSEYAFVLILSDSNITTVKA
jgi:hypothetical protein